MTTERPTLPLPNPGEWGTVRAAADRLGVDESTVRRYITARKLTGYTVRTGRGEEPRFWLWWADVEEVAAARARLKGH